MTDSEVGPVTREELNDDLKRLLRRAAGNGVDVRGGWACRNGQGHSDWDVVVTEVQKTGEQ
jgi:hypothetical protein